MNFALPPVIFFYYYTLQKFYLFKPLLMWQTKSQVFADVAVDFLPTTSAKLGKSKEKKNTGVMQNSPTLRWVKTY
jgi:hypothetical protein